ncbi:GspG family T2SS major pseudopilin variant XcpT [Arenicella sp. 4NH20-0111]|uniref:type II secretion system major pseudopilin GspG n=1 Tax=Arenicella sp. 4NH20-0111 TaxID=3127648 RepID=UPI003108A4F4
MNHKNVIHKHSNQRGFTLIEIMVVVIIISILSALVAPQFFNKLDQAKEIAVQNDIKSISSQMAMYRLDNYSYPNTGEGIKALVSNTGKKTWRGPYLPKMPLDPWKNEYQYQFPGTHNVNGFDVWSFGADGQAGGEGSNRDLGNWDEAK